MNLREYLSPDTKPLIIMAGEANFFLFAGADGGGAVTVDFYNTKGTKIETAENVPAGYWTKISWSYCHVNSTVSQNVTIGHSLADGGLAGGSQAAADIATVRRFTTVVIPAATATILLASDPLRKRALFYPDGDIFTHEDNTVDATGWPTSSGALTEDENTGVLWAYCVAGCNVRLYEDMIR